MSSWRLMDESALFFIHRHLHFKILDAVAPYWRSMYFWTPVYVFFIVYVALNFKGKGMIYLLFLISVIAVSDTLSSKIIKPVVERVRPCNNPAIAPYLKILVPCGSGYSFPSSHAVNHFAGAVFVLLTFFTDCKSPPKWALISWAISIAFGQVYVGVHYPLDVLCGAALGALIGYLGAILYNRQMESLALVT